MENFLFSAAESVKAHNLDEWNEIKQRFYLAAGCANHNDFARYLGIGRSKILAARRHLIFPAEWFQAVLLQSSTDPNWVKTGSGRMISSVVPVEA